MTMPNVRLGPESPHAGILPIYLQATYPALGGGGENVMAQTFKIRRGDLAETQTCRRGLSLEPFPK